MKESTMGEIAKFNPAQTPAFARKGELSTLAKSLAGGGVGGGGKRISIKGGVFRLMADGKEITSIDDRHLDVVIVNAAPKISRTYYEGTYEEGVSKAPDCWSADGDKPDPTAENPQSSDCASCPMNVKGSGQGESKACRFSQRLAVVLANDIGGDVMQLTLAATSIFGKEEGDKRPLQAYARYLAAQNISPETLVTRLRFDTKAAVPKLFFQPVRWLEDDEFEIVAEKGQSASAKQAITMTVAKATTDKPLQLEGSKPKAKAPVVEADTDDGVDEPEKRKPAVKASAVPQKKASNLAATVEEWDDE
jgi:hypothetical protein